jgi:pilus assembly protein CpaB
MTYRVRNIGIAAALAVVAALLTVYFVNSAQQDSKEGNALVSVVVAVKDIVAGTPGTKLSQSDVLEQRELPRKSIVPGAVSNPQQVADLVATDTIYAGEQVTVRRFRPLAQQGVLAKLSGTSRAFQVPGTQHQLLAGTLKEGDRVDVVASIKYKVKEVSPTASETVGGLEERVASRVVLRDLLVLRAAEDPSGDGGLASSVAPSLSATLAVTDAQAQKLFWVMKNSDWSLQLRPVNNPKDSPGSVETAQSVLTDGLRQTQRAELTAGSR